MTKEKLKLIKEYFKKTILKMYKEQIITEMDPKYFNEKITIINDKVKCLCDGNSQMAIGIIDSAFEELKKEAVGGDFNYLIKEKLKNK